MTHPCHHAVNMPDKVAYEMAQSGIQVTYRELDDASNQGAQLLRSLGLKANDHIAVFMENNPWVFKIAFACQRSGIYYTLISSRLTAPEVAYIVNDCAARIFISSAALKDVAIKVPADTPNVEKCFMVEGTAPGFDSWEDAVAAQPVARISDEIAGVDMLYSSGTTGRPKGVKLPMPGTAPDVLSDQAQAMYTNYQMDLDTAYLSPAPLYHAAPLRFCMAVLRLGAKVIVMEHFDAEEFLALVDKHKVTHTQTVPTMFVRMLKLPEEVRKKYDVSSLKICIHAAAPCPIEVKRSMIDWWGPVLKEYYAGSESIGSTYITSEEWLQKPGSVGKAMNCFLHIVDEDGNELPPGEIGTVYFSGGTTFEYFNDPEKTRNARNEKGWSTLGDVGYVDEDGYLFLTDRKAFMIISGGVNIYPQEVENLLIGHDKVADVAVFGVPNEDFGEEVKAVVQPMDMKDAGPELEQQLIAFCKANLSSIKCPRSVDFEEELPRHPTGKLYKRLLRDRYWGKKDSKIV